MLKSKKSQTWSLDAMLSFMVFIFGIVIVLYFLLFASGKDVLKQLQKESELIPMKIIASEPNIDNDLAFIIDGKVNKERLKSLSSYDYDQLKTEFGVLNDFCIYFEDKDGNLVDISSELGADVYGVGNPEFALNEHSCGRTT